MGCYFKMNKLLPKKKLTLNRVDRFGRVFCDLKQSYSDTNIRLIRMIDLSKTHHWCVFTGCLMNMDLVIFHPGVRGL